MIGNWLYCLRNHYFSPPARQEESSTKRKKDSGQRGRGNRSGPEGDHPRGSGSGSGSPRRGRGDGDGGVDRGGGGQGSPGPRNQAHPSESHHQSTKPRPRSFISNDKKAFVEEWVESVSSCGSEGKPRLARVALHWCDFRSIG